MLAKRTGSKNQNPSQGLYKHYSQMISRLKRVGNNNDFREDITANRLLRIPLRKKTALCLGCKASSPDALRVLSRFLCPKGITAFPVNIS